MNFGKRELNVARTEQGKKYFCQIHRKDFKNFEETKNVNYLI